MNARQAVALTPDGAGDAPGSDHVTAAIACPPPRWPVLRTISSYCDPDWALFLVVLLLPALWFLGFRQPLKAHFFAGTAIYLAVLKWLGWIALGRKSQRSFPFLLFPAEVFAGLALTCAWFYLRNQLARWWPASYSLRELSILFYILVPMHTLGLLRGVGRTDMAGIAQRLALFLPFTACLTIALWAMSGSLTVLGTDGIHYVFSARVYRAHGVFFAVPPLGRTIVYPSAFSGMVAVTSSLAPLTVVQAFSLQHVALCILALFLITTAVATIVQRPLPILHSFPLLFLSIFPLYALFPDVLYPGVPKQVGPPLWTAVCLIPLVMRATTRAGFIVEILLVAILAVVSADLNPACALYAGMAWILAFFVLFGQGRKVFKIGVFRIVIMQMLAAALVALLVISVDVWYCSMAKAVFVSSEATALPEGSTPKTTPRFSLEPALHQLRSVSLFQISPAISNTTLMIMSTKVYNDWPAKYPQKLLPLAAFFIVIMIVFARILGRYSGQNRIAAAGRIALTSWLLLAGLKYAVGFLSAGFIQNSWAASLFVIYNRYLLVRCELLLLFVCLVAGVVWFFTEVRRKIAPPDHRQWLQAVGALLICCATFAVVFFANVAMSGTTIIPTNARFPITPEDLALVRWADEHLPPEKGNIGLAAFVFAAGSQSEEKHIYPVGPGVAFSLYGRNYNYRFQFPALEGNQGWDDYRDHIRDRFDAAWCENQRIRYVFIPNSVRDGSETPKNDSPGLRNAIKDGTLRVIRRTSMSALYEITTTKIAECGDTQRHWC